MTGTLSCVPTPTEKRQILALRPGANPKEVLYALSWLVDTLENEMRNVPDAEQSIGEFGAERWSKLASAAKQLVDGLKERL